MEVMICLIGFFGAGVVHMLFRWYHARKEENLWATAFETSSFYNRRVYETDSLKKYFSRPEEEARVDYLLRTKTVWNFYIVTGERGTGKSTLVRHCCKGISHGLLYFEAPELPHRFCYELAFAVDYSWHHDILSQALLCTVFEKIHEDAHQYYMKYGEAPVLVLDKLTNYYSCPFWYEILACSKKLRLDPVMVEVSDLHGEEAARFLQFLHLPPQFQAIDVYDIVGGRVTDLRSVVEACERGLSLENIRTTLLARARQDFADMDFLQVASDAQARFWSKLHSLYLAGGRVTATEFWDMFGEAGNKLLKLNICIYHQEYDSVSFYSRPTELFVDEFFHSAFVLL